MLYVIICIVNILVKRFAINKTGFYKIHLKQTFVNNEKAVLKFL